MRIWEQDYWIQKVKNIVHNYDESQEYIKICDYIFFQEICKKNRSFQIGLHY
jgi:hypothetical protein